MNLRALSDDALWQRTQDLAAEERRITLAVLYHLREIERRMLYAARGFSNLKEYCTQVLKYSESSAYRRIASMRLLREVPELDEKFKSGEITLSNAAQAQTHFHKVKKQTKKAPSAEEKRVLLSKIESLSSRSCESLLGELRGDAAPEEKSRPINANETQYSFTTDRETEEMLEAIQRELHRTLSMRDLIKEMAKLTLKALQEKRQRSEKRVGNRQGNASQAGMAEQELGTSIFDRKKQTIVTERKLDSSMGGQMLDTSMANREIKIIVTVRESDASMAGQKIDASASDRTTNTVIAGGTFDSFTDKLDVLSATSPTTTKASCDATPTPEPCAQRSTRPESISSAKNRTGNHLESNAPAKNRIGNHASSTLRPFNRHTRYISVSAEREVWERAGARCQYVDSKTGRRCAGTRHLQIEHVHPHAFGGSNELSNIELLCPAHNRLRAVGAYGRPAMRVFIPSLR